MFEGQETVKGPSRTLACIRIHVCSSSPFKALNRTWDSKVWKREG